MHPSRKKPVQGWARSGLQLLRHLCNWDQPAQEPLQPRPHLFRRDWFEEGPAGRPVPRHRLPVRGRLVGALTIHWQRRPARILPGCGADLPSAYSHHVDERQRRKRLLGNGS